MQSDITEVASVAEASLAPPPSRSRASTQQTSASTQEIASSAQELAAHRRAARRLVGRFKTTASERAPRAKLHEGPACAGPSHVLRLARPAPVAQPDRATAF